MKKLGILIFILGMMSGLYQAQAQVVIDNTLTPTQLVEDVLLGQGVVVSNITFTGNAAQIGFFDATNGIFPIPEGIIMSTGDVTLAPDVAIEFAGGIESTFGLPGDPDMTTLAGDVTADAAILQFEFVPTGDSISFSFVFASEEYPDFVNFANDAFAFLISGPGFNGPYINSSENIALIPGTNLPVTIDNVNDVIPANVQYYINNESGGPNGVIYNGYTVSIEARAAVTCGETYVLRFVIADAFDDNYDSAIFLEANSFQSNAVTVNITTASGSPQEGGGWIVENCTPAEILFERPASAVDTAIWVPIEISGSAINGLDYTGVPDSVYFAVGDTSVSISLFALDDNLVEPNDSIVLTVYSLNLCGDTTVSTGTIHIYDFGSYSYSVETSDPLPLECTGDSVLITVSASMGNPEYEFTWSNGFVGDSIWVQPTENTWYYVTTEDACGTPANLDSALVEYLVNPNPNVTINGSTSFNCVPQSVLLSANASLGNSPYTYAWSNGAATSAINVTLNSDTVFYVVATDECGVASEADTIVISQNPVSIPQIQTSADVVLDCPGETATLTAIASGGVQPYTYNWSSGQSTSTINVQPTQTTNYIVTVADDCYEGEVTDTIIVTVEPYTEPSVSINDTTVLCPGDLVMYSADVDNGNDPFQYTWSVGGSGTSVSLNPMTTMDVTITVEDDCGMTTSSTATVTVPVYDPLAVTILNTDLLTGDTVVVCELWSDTLVSSVTGGLSPYSYNWTGVLIDGAWLQNDSAKVTVPYELAPDSSVIGLYTVTVTDECLEQETAEVVVAAISCDIVQPGIFNPNSTFAGTTDFCGNVPQNNVFNLPCLNLYPGNTVTIWDRWGRKCYRTDDYHVNPWDGGNQSTGTYYYVCELPGDKEPVKGYFQLIR